MRQQKIIFDLLKNCILGHWSILYKITFSKKCHFLPEKCIFLRKMAFWPPSERVVVAMSKKFFLGHIFTLFFDEMKTGQDWAQYVRPIFPLLPAHFHNFLWKGALKMIFDIKIWFIIVKYNFCMIPHFLTFCFNLGHFCLKPNPTGLQDDI